MTTTTTTIIVALLCCAEIAFASVASTKKALEEEILAQKIEKLLKISNNPKVDQAKEELAKQVEYNFVKTLSAVLVTGPIQAQQSQSEIVKLLKHTLNGDLDFMPVVSKMPELLRETDEAKRFTMVLKTVGQTGKKVSRQFAGLQNVGKILDVASKINPKEVSTFLKEIPEIFEGVETIVDGVDEYFK